jgi:hypothetical protein
MFDIRAAKRYCFPGSKEEVTSTSFAGDVHVPVRHVRIPLNLSKGEVYKSGTDTTTRNC